MKKELWDDYLSAEFKLLYNKINLVSESTKESRTNKRFIKHYSIWNGTQRHGDLKKEKMATPK